MQITKALIRLRGCADWSAPLLFANPRRQVFSRRGPYDVGSVEKRTYWFPCCYLIVLCVLSFCVVILCSVLLSAGYCVMREYCFELLINAIFVKLSLPFAT